MNKINISKIPFTSLSKPKNKIGLDIGTSCVKLVSLTSRKPAGFELDYFSVQKFEKENSRESVISAIKQVTAARGVKIQRVVISVSGQGVVVRQVLFPVMSDEELKSALAFEAEKYIPFNINEVYLDAQIMDKKTEDGKAKVLIVAAKRELVDERLSLLNAAGLEVEAVDCDSIAATNAFIFNNPGLTKEKTVALVNIGAHMANICIIKNEILNFVRDIPIVPENSGSMETQVRLSFDYYENQFGKGIDGIYVSGGGSKEAGLLESLKQSFGIETQYWDPIKGLSISPGLDTQALKEVSSQMAVCVGLAMRR